MDEPTTNKNDNLDVIQEDSPVKHRHRFPSFRKHKKATDQAETTSKTKDDTTEFTLKVNVLQARNLHREDETNIPSAYATVRLGGIRQRTDTIKKSSDPEWQCSFEFDLSNDIMPYKKRQRALAHHGLSITVYSKDRFSSIFLGQTTLALDHIQYVLFDQAEAKWFPLTTQRQHKRFNLKKSRQAADTSVAGDQPEILVQFGFVSKGESGDTSKLIQQWQSMVDKYYSSNEPDEYEGESDLDATSELDAIPPPLLRKSSSTSSFSQRLMKLKKSSSSISEQSDHLEEPQTQTKKKKRLGRFRRRRNKKDTGYAKFYSDVMGIMFLEVESAKDLPPEKNVTRTGFDMDPFVIVSYGVSTFRTRAIRHNLNPTWNEKLFFHVRNSESNYKLKFAVYDKDKFSGNDFVASQEISIAEIMQGNNDQDIKQVQKATDSPCDMIEQSMGQYTVPLALKKSEKWKDSLNPTLTFRAKFVPYVEIRKMFWIALAKACDADNSNSMSRLEIQTMLETLGSTISETTLDQFWKDNGKDPNEDLTMDELVKSLEAFLVSSDAHAENPEITVDDTAAQDDDEFTDDLYDEDDYSSINEGYLSSTTADDDELRSGTSTNPSTPPSLEDDDLEALEDAEGVQYMEGSLSSLQLEAGDEESEKPLQEKVIRLTECPVCHKPNLYRRGQLDIITHVATCAANDWTTVDRFLMGNYGSEAQAQRKWFVKLVSKVGYGKYSIGKNNANIIVQDRLTGQLIDERMSVYVRLGMRLVYKGMKSRIQSKTAKRILANMSVKQGRRFDDPLSVREIRPFIKFHKLDMSQVLEPIENFKTFNEFFYRKLKPGSRPCDSPDNKKVVVSPADCRMMAFPTIDSATSIWIKGVDFSIAKLLDDPEEAKHYAGGSLAIFRLAPQDYHRFHSPVDGVVTKIHHVAGQYYTVNPMAIRTTLDVYGDNKRDVVHFDTEEFGKVAVVCVGAMMVGSIVLTAGVGDHLARTDELGYFAFGGSTLVVLFEKNTVQFDKDLQDNANDSLETLVAVGNHIGVHI